MLSKIHRGTPKCIFLVLTSSFSELQDCIPNCLSFQHFYLHIKHLKFHKLLIFLSSPPLPVVFPLSANANPFRPVTQTKKLEVVPISFLSLRSLHLLHSQILLALISTQNLTLSPALLPPDPCTIILPYCANLPSVLAAVVPVSVESVLHTAPECCFQTQVGVAIPLSKSSNSGSLAPSKNQAPTKCHSLLLSL